MIDTRSNEIINVVQTNVVYSEQKQAILDHFEDSEHLRLDADPPDSMLERYRYWNERP